MSLRLLLVPGNQICLPPVTTELCPGLCSATKFTWHQGNSHFLLVTNPVGPSWSVSGLLNTPFVPFCSRLVSWAAVCCLGLVCEQFFLVFMTSAAIHDGGHDLCTCVSDREEWGLLRGFINMLIWCFCHSQVFQTVHDMYFRIVSSMFTYGSYILPMNTVFYAVT